MKSLTKLLAVALALALIYSTPASTQVVGYSPLQSQRSVSAAVSDDTDIALLVKYVGDEASGLVAVAAGGDITFTDGAEGSEAATDTFECPVSGALGGVIDVSDAACDTLGEVVDIINASSDWRAVILDGLRADSSNDTLNALSAAAATSDDGLGLLWDTSTAFKASMKLGAPRSMRAYLGRSNAQGASFVPNPGAGRTTAFMRGNGTSTYGSGTSTLQVISVTPKLGTAGSEVTRTLYATPGGATTANKELVDDLISDPDSFILWRINNSAAASAVAFYGYGITFKNQ